MALTAHMFPTFIKNTAVGTQSPVVKIGTDNVTVVLIGTGNTLATTLNSTIDAMDTLTSILAGSGGGALTEVSGGSYSRGSITGATLSMAISLSAGTAYNSLACSASSISWSSVTFAAQQAVFIDMTANGGNGQGICYWDFGGSSSVSAGTFTLNFGTGSNSVANCLCQWTST